jgi:hypothetical protein
MRLDEDNADELFVRLIKQPRAFIDAIDAIQPRTWSQLRAIIAAARKNQKRIPTRSEARTDFGS